MAIPGMREGTGQIFSWNGSWIFIHRRESMTQPRKRSVKTKYWQELHSYQHSAKFFYPMRLAGFHHTRWSQAFLSGALPLSQLWFSKCLIADRLCGALSAVSADKELHKSSRFLCGVPHYAALVTTLNPIFRCFGATIATAN